MKKALFVFCALVLMVCFGMVHFFFHTPSPQSTKVITIGPSSIKQIQSQLYQEGVLTSRHGFEILTRLTGKSSQVQSGEYKFNLPSSPWNVLNQLTQGKVVLHKITIPEGWTMTDIKNLLASEDLANAQTLQDLFYDASFIQSLGISASSLEGYLFPETYHFSKSESEKQILQAMVTRCQKKLSTIDQSPLQIYGWNLHQWITFASIVEKESSLTQEQPLISSVFHNRLKKNMRLQSDPTVIYGIENYDGNIRKKDLLTPTPYNTYTQKGLPPGPIASPGLSALKASLYPENTDYLYFVANKAGSHVFSKSYAEHHQAVQTYQLSR